MKFVVTRGRGIIIGQRRYTDKLLDRFEIQPTHARKGDAERERRRQPTIAKQHPVPPSNRRTPVTDDVLATRPRVRGEPGWQEVCGVDRQGLGGRAEDLRVPELDARHGHLDDR